MPTKTGAVRPVTGLGLGSAMSGGVKTRKPERVKTQPVKSSKPPAPARREPRKP